METFAIVLTIMWMVLTIGLLIAALVGDGQSQKQEETTDET